MRTNKNNPVYGKTYDEIVVKSSSSPTRTYSVRLGEVTWNEKIGTVLAIYIVVEYNGRAQMFHKPVIPHFLVEPDLTGESDYVRVLKAMEAMGSRHNLM